MAHVVAEVPGRFGDAARAALSKAALLPPVTVWAEEGTSPLTRLSMPPPPGVERKISRSFNAQCNPPPASLPATMPYLELELPLFVTPACGLAHSEAHREGNGVEVLVDSDDSYAQDSPKMSSVASFQSCAQDSPKMSGEADVVSIGSSACEAADEAVSGSEVVEIVDSDDEPGPDSNTGSDSKTYSRSLRKRRRGTAGSK